MSSPNKFRLVPVTDRHDEWDELVKNSPQGTIFSLYYYLQSINRPFKLYFIYKGNEIKAGVVLNTTSDGRRTNLDDLVIYNGILFRADPLQKAVKSRQEKFEITEFVLEELESRFDLIEMALHPSLEDLRPILWRNYHDACVSKRYKVDLRYTSYLDISEFFLQRNELSMRLFEGLDNIRQSDIRKARRDQVQVLQGDCAGKFVDFYSNMMASQQHPVATEEKARMRSLIEALLAKGLAKLFHTRNVSGDITYITIFTLYENHACYLFGAGDMEKMARYDGTICLWEAFRQLAMCGIREIDMEGINSPLRGGFKLSFGGDIRPYFHIRHAGSGCD